jgi:ATP-binding cassette subfamily B protein
MHQQPMNHLSHLIWPISQAAKALGALATARGLPHTEMTLPIFSGPINAEDQHIFARWFNLAVERLNLEVEPLSARYAEVAMVLGQASPALLHIARTDEQPGLLAILKADKQMLTLIGPDQRHYRLPLANVQEALCASVEAPLVPSIEQFLDTIDVAPRRRAQVRSTLLRERLSQTDVLTGWLLRLPPTASLWEQARIARLPRLTAGMLGAHIVQYILWLWSWWILSSSVVDGHMDTGWVQAWVLVLLTMVPLRMLSAWCQGEITVRGGALLKQRLLAGCLRLPSEQVRQHGVGKMLGTAIEAEMIEVLALSGGLMSLVAMTELLILMGALILQPENALLALLLAIWFAGAVLFARLYWIQYQQWTALRLQMTHQNIEHMVGHRTRLIQENVTQWHTEEDQALAQYLARSRVRDTMEAVLLSLVARGWLIVGLVGVVLLFSMHALTLETLTLGLGAVFFAYLSLHMLTEGLGDLVGAGVAWQQIGPLVQAAAQAEERGQAPHLLDETPATSAEDSVLDMRNLTFRYRSQGEPVLRACTLQIFSGERLLLQGASGSGKSTLAAMLSGIHQPDSGLLLLNGLDWQSIGAARWRQQVVMVPQFHDNHVFTASFAFNVLMGRAWPPTDEDLDMVWTICEELGLGDLLDRMPGGVFQHVGDTGWQLSHGEKSRLYLARALAQAPQIVVVDESFAALDPATSQQAMQCTMQRAATLVVIAHP